MDGSAGMDAAGGGKLYDSNYYASHCGSIPYDRSQAHWGTFFGGIADELIRSFRPGRVFDAGCAHGFLVEAFWDRGVEAWGRDLSEFAISCVRPDMRQYCTVGSIATAIPGRYDLVTCIEVVEHMPEAEALDALAAISAVTDRIVFSSSPTDFEEPTHINVRPTLYWLRAFARLGFAPVAGYSATFITPHALVFERAEEGRRDADLIAWAEIIRQRLMCADRDQTIRDLQSRAIAAQADIGQINQTVTELRAELDKIRAEADQTRGDAVELRAELIKSRAEAPQSNAQMIQLQTELEMLRPKLQHLADQRDHVVSQNLAIRLSTSWRVTGPLRWVKHLLNVASSPVSLRAKPSQLLSTIGRNNFSRLLANPRVREILIAIRHSRPGSTVWHRLRRSSTVRRLVIREVGALTQAPEVIVSGQTSYFYEPQAGLLPWFNPLSIDVGAELANRPALNVLIPGLAKHHLSGGPNTALYLACRLAQEGVAVRLISTDASPDADATQFWAHLRALTDTRQLPPHIELIDGSDRGRKLRIGVNDVFLATAWWTAQMAKYAIRHTRHARFIYLIQDYEPLLHPASTQQALAEETYRLDFVPVVNSALLYEFLCSRQIGRFADAAFAAEAIVFEPAVNAKLFAPATAAKVAPLGRRRLLFYARPTAGQRNAYELGLAALQKLIVENAIDPAEWEFVAMGERIPPAPLGGGAMLLAAPWLDLNGYAELVRGSDVLLSPMLSPHPSYPPLEMAACGRPVVTTVYGNKSAERLAAISPNIIGAEATIEGLSEGLLVAIRRAQSGVAAKAGPIGLPNSWAESFATVVPRVHKALLELLGAPPLAEDARVGVDSLVFPGYRYWPRDRYNILRFDLLSDRTTAYRYAEPGIISLVTTVWNTDPVFVTELAESVFGQDAGGAFEWIILDNGTTRADTRRLLDRLSGNPTVRLLRVDDNVGIIGGLHRCLQAARNRYIVPLDSDDLLTPDCLRIVTSSLRAANFPALAYTDEDKVLDNVFRDPYCKPDWDPVLFVHSCYIAHLCAIDRTLALQLGVYTDRQVEGSHDGDSFMRFHLAGYTPLHIPELVYTWRMHPQSTSGNIASKDYIFSSQKKVLQRFIDSLPHPDLYDLELSPLFDNTPDWRITRRRDPSPSIAAILLMPEVDDAPSSTAAADPSPPAASDLRQLLAIVEPRADEDSYLHLMAPQVIIDNPTWAMEAVTLLELFPDAVMIGGPVRRDGIVVAADGYAGFRAACYSPNLGRPRHDPGYFAQMWKPHSADAVPTLHCVVRTGFLTEALRVLVGTGASLAALGAWLGVLARSQGKRLIYSPFLSAIIPTALCPISPVEQGALAIAFAGLPAGPRFMSHQLGETAETAYQPVNRQERLSQENVARQASPMIYAERHVAELMARRIIGANSNVTCRLSLLTLVYSGSPSEYLRELARSVFDQTLPCFEWIILENGTITEELTLVLAELKEHSCVREFRTNDLGIIGGLRFCLEQATGEFVVPLDADDLLTPDALQQLAVGLLNPSRPAFVFSDEDIITGERVDHPYRRWPFDPVLNAVDSYIWHLCAFRRDRALELGVYSDRGAEMCHDWDTITRFEDAGAPIGHVPHVLYHWRTHERSSSNSGSVDRRSLNSVRHHLERTIARQERPELYEVGPCPVDRGAEQYAILRRPEAPLPLCLVYLASSVTSGSVPPSLLAALGSAVSETYVAQYNSTRRHNHVALIENMVDNIISAYVLLLDADDVVPTSAGVWEAMRMFEMHADLGAAGGRIIDAAQTVIAACRPVVMQDGISDGWIGMSRSDPGPFALALKPQTVATLPDGYFLCRTELLRTVVADWEQLPGDATLADRVAAACLQTGMRIGYSPLIEAVCEGKTRPRSTSQSRRG